MFFSIAPNAPRRVLGPRWKVPAERAEEEALPQGDSGLPALEGVEVPCSSSCCCCCRVLAWCTMGPEAWFCLRAGKVPGELRPEQAESRGLSTMKRSAPPTEQESKGMGLGYQVKMGLRAFFGTPSHKKRPSKSSEP
jgi:hypothetical protein